LGLGTVATLDTVSVATGGTGATSASAARTALGLVIGTNVLAPGGDGSSLTGIASGATDAEAANIMLNAFRIAVNGGLSVQNMVDGVVDEFEDATGVDADGSTNETHITGDKKYSNQDNNTSYSNTGGTGNRTSIITVTDTDSYWTGGSPYKLVDGNLTASALYEGGNKLTAGATLIFDFGSGADKIIDEAKLYSDDAGDYGTWKWQGSNNNSTWVDIGSSYLVYGGTSGTAQTSLAGNTTGWRYYRWEGVSGSTSPPTNELWEMEFKIATAGGPIVNMVLVSNATTALATPDNAFIVIRHEPVDTLTINTDVKVYASRDGGTTYSQGTLSKATDLSGDEDILVADVSFSGDPSGTAMKWKFETLNTKLQYIHAISLQWS